METDDHHSLRVASFACYLDPVRDKMVRTVSSQETNTPPIKPPFGIKFSKNNQDPTNLRVDSFSYLNTTNDHNFVFEVPGPIQDPTSAFTFSHEIPKDGEIGVFNADKYFNMKLEYKTEQKTEPISSKPIEIKPRTPSLCSESTSWNSQSTLLPNLNRIESLAKKKANGRRIFNGFGCRGPCFDKKSVHINEIVAQRDYYAAKASQVGSERTVQVHQDDARPSIEVFGSSNNSSKGGIATNMERKLSMLTWDAIPKGRAIPSSKNGSTSICDEIASDASSDLFEIENISGSVFPLEQGDEMSSCLSPASIYAPSEASIQWSVVTASAADYSVVLDEARVMSAKTGFGGGRETKKGGLLGCKNVKAVDVAENVCVKSSEKVKKMMM